LLPDFPDDGRASYGRAFVLPPRRLRGDGPAVRDVALTNALASPHSPGIRGALRRLASAMFAVSLPLVSVPAGNAFFQPRDFPPPLDSTSFSAVIAVDGVSLGGWLRFCAAAAR